MSPKARLFERKRVVAGVIVAAVFHVAVGLAWWLTPPLRLTAGIDPARWVGVFSVPGPVPMKSLPAPDLKTPAATDASQGNADPLAAPSSTRVDRP